MRRMTERAGVGLLGLLLLAGCATSDLRMPGTEGQAGELLARLLVQAHPERPVESRSGSIHLRALVVDGISHEIGGADRTLWVAPGEHAVRADWEECAHWPATWFRANREAHVTNAFAPAPLQAEAGQAYRLGGVLSISSGVWVALTFEKVDP